MSEVFFLSGWAGPEALFPGVSGRVAFAAPFLDGDEAALLERAAASRADTLAGWSTGAHMILKHATTLLPRFRRVVLFAPFARFADSLPARITRAMLTGMETAPEQTVRAFWKNCGAPLSPAWNPAWTAPLAAGLAYLLGSAAPETPVAANGVTVVWGEADRIVRRAAVQKALALLPGASFQSHAGGHYPDPTLLAELLF